jgi:hypothetical protein
MLNPFMLDPNGKWEKDSRPTTEESHAQNHGILVRQATARNRTQLSLRLGLLLIRMGKELTGERAFQEGWFGDQVNTPPARFHNA